MPRTARATIGALARLTVLASLAVLAGCRVPEGPRLPDADTGIRVCTSPREAQTGGALSYYRFGHSECGRATEVEVIAIHGANADGLVFARLAASLRPDERERFVSVDLPGHGRSELPAGDRPARADPPWLADELLPLIDWLAPDDRPRLLLCHSLAGPVCVRLLERARSRGLAGIGAHVFRSMQGDHSSINTIPEQVVARLRLADPCAAPGLGDPVERLPAEVERLLADID